MDSGRLRRNFSAYFSTEEVKSFIDRPLGGHGSPRNGSGSLSPLALELKRMQSGGLSKVKSTIAPKTTLPGLVKNVQIDKERIKRKISDMGDDFGPLNSRNKYASF